MAELMTIARPYARAIFEYASQKNSVDEWSKVLDLLAMILKNQNIIAFIEHPKTGDLQIVTCILNTIKSLLQNSKLDSKLDTEAINNWLAILVANKRLKLSQLISNAFDMMRSKSRQEVLADITVSEKVSTDTLSKITVALQDKIKKTPIVSINEDAAIIGGLVIKVGDMVTDASIKVRLKKLKKHMML